MSSYKRSCDEGVLTHHHRHPVWSQTGDAEEDESGHEDDHDSDPDEEALNDHEKLELLKRSVLEMSFNRVDGPEDLYVGG
jgi:hypothetical protein